MSIKAVKYVKNQARAGGFAQAVLLFLADCHNAESCQCNPSRETIREFFSSEDEPCSIKRIERALKELRDKGFIRSVKRTCKSGVLNWYEIVGLEAEDSPQNGGYPQNIPNPQNGGYPQNIPNPQNGGYPQNGGGVAPKMGVRGSPQNGGRNRNKNRKEQEEVADACASLISTAECRAETVPTPQEPFSLKAEKPKEKRNTGEIDRPDSIPEQDWADWKLARKSRRAGPITQTAWNLLVKEAAKAGITPAQAVELCAGRSWISFQAKYLREEDKPQKSQFEVSADRLADLDNRFSVKAVR